MNYLDFFASIIASLSWPTSVIGIACIFRREIRPLLPRMRLKHKDTEIDFRLDEAERAAEHLPPPSPESPPPSPEELSKFERLARISPRSAVLELRRSVEDVIRTLANISAPGPTYGSARTLLRMLRIAGILDSSAVSLLDEVLAAGNIAAHESNAVITYEDAVRFRDLAERGIQLLEEQLAKRPPISPQP